MAYTANIPQPTDIPAQSQNQIFNNFLEINTFVNTDHGVFNSGATEGAHNKVSFIPQTGAIVWPAGVNFGLYATAAGILEHTPAGNINISALTLVGTINYMYLPTGALVKYGTTASDTGGHIYIDLNAGGVPAYATARFAFLTGKHIPHFTICAEDNNDGGHPVLRYLYVSTHNDAGVSQGNSQFNWLTIGT